nr:Ig-like domain-containing protein [Tessaracoccus coleopterorum]
MDTERVEARTTPGVLPTLPDGIWVTYEATSERAEAGDAPLVNDVPVTWDLSDIPAADYDAAGDVFTVDGTIEGSGFSVEATVAVHAAPLSDAIADVDPVSTLTTPGSHRCSPAQSRPRTRTARAPAAFPPPGRRPPASTRPRRSASPTRRSGRVLPGLGLFFVVAPPR